MIAEIRGVLVVGLLVVILGHLLVPLGARVSETAYQAAERSCYAEGC